MSEKEKAPAFTVKDRRGEESEAKPAMTEADLRALTGGADVAKIGAKVESTHPFVVAAREGRFLPISGRVLLRAVMQSDLSAQRQEAEGVDADKRLVGVDAHARAAVFHVVEAIAPDVDVGTLRVGDKVMHISAAEDRLDETDATCPFSLVIARHITGVCLDADDERLTKRSPLRDREAYLRATYGAGLPEDTPIETLEALEKQERMERRATPKWPTKLE